MRHPSGRGSATPSVHTFSRRARPSAARFTVLLILMLAAGAVFVAPALGAGGISGIVQTELVQPIADAQVVVWRSPDGTAPYAFLGVTFTDGNGAYTVPTPGAGWYKVEFSDYLGRYVTEWWANRSGTIDQADAIQLGEDESAGWVHAVLQSTGRAGGHVAAVGSGVPLENIRVDVFRWDDGSQQWQGHAMALTDAAGDWSIGGLTPGQFRFHFRDELGGVYADQFWSHQQFWDNAWQEGVYGGWDVNWINADLEAGGFVNGVVRDEWGAPIQGAVVTATSYNANTDSWPGVRQTTTDEFGQYTLGPLATGPYKLWFQGGPAYLAEWWEDKRSDWEADLTWVNTGQSEVRDASLAAAGTISGHVTADGTGLPIEAIAISLYRWNGWDWWPVEGGWWFTDADGFYSVGGLEPGNYRVQFIDPNGAWATEYYDDVPGWTGPNEVPVLGGITTVSDASLAPAGHIAGYVHDEYLNPISGIDVSSWLLLDRDNNQWDWVGGAQTDESGYFDIGGLPAGVHQIELSDPNGTYAVEVYEDGLNFGQGYDLVVEPGLTTWAYPVLAAGGRLYGQVVGASGEGLGDVQVTFHGWIEDDPETGDGHYEWYTECWTDQNGDFSMPGLMARPTLVSFWDSSGQHLGEYYDDAPREDQATPVVVPGGGSRNLGVIELAPAGHIAGTVIAEGGGPLESIEVTVARWRDDWGDWDFFTGAMTDASGWYDVGDLATGDYRVWFGDPSGIYTGEFYDNAHDVWVAQDVTVAAGDTTYVDADLDPAAAIEGNVRDELGNPLAGIEAILYFQEDWGEWVRFSSWDERTFTDGDGYFRFGGLPARKYQLRLENGENPDPWAAEVFDGALVPGTGTDLDPVPGETLTVDPVLDAGGSLAGRLLDDETSEPLSFAFPMSIEVWTWIADPELPEGGSWRSYAEYATGDGTDGYMHGVPLAPGEYRVDFDCWPGAYVYEAWQDQPDLEHATPVTIVADEITDLGDIFMTRSAMIFGRVTGPDGEPVGGVQVRQLEFVDGAWEPFYSFETWPDGYYQLGNMVGGTYRVEFDGRGIGLSREYWDDAASALSAADIVLAPREEVYNIDAQLSACGALEGTVRLAGGELAVGAPVRVAQWDDAAGRYIDIFDMSSSATDENGYWRMDAVTPGTYRVTAGPSGTHAEGSVQGVEVAQEETTTVDLTLPFGASISGEVTDLLGVPVSTGVSALAWSDDDHAWRELMEAPTATDGTYTLAPLSPGTYRVRFGSPGEGFILHTEFWDNRWPIDEAFEITLAEGQARAGIDAVLGPAEDETPPSAPEVTGADDAWHAEPVELDFSATDDLSGVAGFEYRFNGGPWEPGDHVVVAAPEDHETDGVWNLEVRAVDEVGNVGGITSAQVKIDTTGPVVSDDDPGQWLRGPVTVNLSAVDAGCGVVDHLEYAPTEDGPWTVGTSFYLRTWKRSGGTGERTTWVRGIDGLGNASEPEAVVVRLDGVAPVTTHDSDGLPHGEDVTVHLTLNDAHSGAGATFFSVDGGMWLVGDTLVVPAHLGGWNDGIHEVRFYSVDAVGNVEVTIRSCLVVIDTSGTP